MRAVLDTADPVRPELRAALDRCGDELSRPGTWWNAHDKRAIADIARAAFVASAAPPGAAERLPAAAADAASRIAASPAGASEAWVRSVCDAIGEPHFVELAGLVAR